MDADPPPHGVKVARRNTAYGADRGTFGYLVAGSALPKARAVQCGTEYDLAVYALQKLFRYHLRDGRMGRARIRRAFRWMF